MFPMKADTTAFDAGLAKAVAIMDKFNRRLEATIRQRLEYFWVCPKCHVENSIRCTDGDSDRRCTNCESAVYVGHASEAQEENWDY